MIKVGGHLREVLAELVGSPKPAACRKNAAQILGESFVHPEQVGLHGLLIIGGGQPGGATVFSVPRMNIFMGQKRGIKFPFGLVDEAAFADAAVVGLMMLESEMRDVVTQCVEKMIVAIMLCSK